MSDNSSNNKRIAKNTVYLYARLLVSLCIGLYTSRAILDALGVTDYGIYNVEPQRLKLPSKTQYFTSICKIKKIHLVPLSYRIFSPGRLI